MILVNENGIEQIHKFLSEHHKLGGDHFDRNMLEAWAEEAVTNAENGSTAFVEIKPWDSVFGRSEIFTISASGLDVIGEDFDDVDDRIVKMKHTV